MSLFSVRALKRAVLTLGILSLFASGSIVVQAQWYSGISATNLGGTSVFNGRTYTIQYIGTDTTAGHTSGFTAPTVTANMTSGPWMFVLNSFNHSLNNSSDTYYLDNGTEAFAGSHYHGPISTAQTSYPNIRSVNMETSTSSGGAALAQANYPFFVYKVTCQNPPDSNPVNVTIATAEGGAASIRYTPMLFRPSETVTIHGVVTTAMGLQATLDYQWVYDPTTAPVSQEAGSLDFQRMYDLSDSITLQPTADGKAVGYLYVTAIPYLSVSASNLGGGIFSAYAGWELIPYAITLGP